MKGLVIFLNKRIIETVSIMCAQTPQTIKNKKTIVQRGSRKKVDSTPTARSPKRKTVSRKKQKKKRDKQMVVFQTLAVVGDKGRSIVFGNSLYTFLLLFLCWSLFIPLEKPSMGILYTLKVLTCTALMFHYQENIDWERLRNASLNSSPVSFVFIKATEGTTLLDDNFNLNFYEAKQNDFIRGAYHFFFAGCGCPKTSSVFLETSTFGTR